MAKTLVETFFSLIILLAIAAATTFALLRGERSAPAR
jgi:hypothetical protein